MLDPDQVLAVQITAALYALGLALLGLAWLTMPLARRWLDALLGTELDGDA